VSSIASIDTDAPTQERIGFSAIRLRPILNLPLLLPLFVFRRHPEPTAKDHRICCGTDEKRITSTGRISLCVCGGKNAGVLQLRFRMTAKNKQQPQ
jgi:hypothetical protein